MNLKCCKNLATLAVILDLFMIQCRAARHTSESDETASNNESRRPSTQKEPIEGFLGEKIVEASGSYFKVPKGITISLDTASVDTFSSSAIFLNDSLKMTVTSGSSASAPITAGIKLKKTAEKFFVIAITENNIYRLGNDYYKLKYTNKGTFIEVATFVSATIVVATDLTTTDESKLKNLAAATKPTLSAELLNDNAYRISVANPSMALYVLGYGYNPSTTCSASGEPITFTSAIDIMLRSATDLNVKDNGTRYFSACGITEGFVAINAEGSAHMNDGSKPTSITTIYVYITENPYPGDFLAPSNESSQCDTNSPSSVSESFFASVEFTPYVDKYLIPSDKCLYQSLNGDTFSDQESPIILLKELTTSLGTLTGKFDLFGANQPVWFIPDPGELEVSNDNCANFTSRASSDLGASGSRGLPREGESEFTYQVQTRACGTGGSAHVICVSKAIEGC